MSAFFDKKQSSPVQTVKLSEITIDESSARFKTDVSDLVKSMAIVGMLQPLMINPAMKLVAGKRRYVAAKNLGWTDVPVVVLTLEAALEEIAAIDENLVRLHLNSVEYDEALLRRKTLYEAKFPESRVGTSKNERTEVSFTEDVASRFDISRRSVYLAVNRAKLASEKVKQARLSGEISPSKVDMLVQVPHHLQDEILPLIKKHTVYGVKEIVEKIRTLGVEKTMDDMKNVVAIGAMDYLSRDLYRIEKHLNIALSRPEPLGLTDKSPVVKQSQGVVRLLRTFVQRVKEETSDESTQPGIQTRHESPNEKTQSAV